MTSVLILGGSSGIGKAVFDRLNDGPRDIERLDSYGAEHFGIKDERALEQAIEDVEPTHVVYSVGINRLDFIADMSVFDFNELMAVNVWGFLSTVQLLHRAVLAAPVSVVAITSDAAWRPMRTSAAYCTSKAALEMAVRVASREMAEWGWRINAVAPGKVADTPMTTYVDRRVVELRGWTPEYAEKYELNSSPLGRPVTKEEVAEVVESVLFGPTAQTGEIIAVNGGR